MNSPMGTGLRPAQVLRAKIADESYVTTGVLCTTHFWPGMVELVIDAGLDYLIVDMEHLSFDAQMVAEACAIGRRVGFPILIRPPAAEFTPVRLAMDLGPVGLLVPMVEDLATMRIIEEAVYLPPRGRRRPGGMGNQWVTSVDHQTWVEEFENDFIVLPQIESITGLANAEAIAAHPMTTAIAVGPYDLSASLGVCWQPQAPRLLDALTTIRTAGESAGKSMWMIGSGPELVARGYRFVCIGEPMAHLQSSLAELSRQTKGAHSK